jgi:beta-barrel assembly-enhancing protease
MAANNPAAAVNLLKPLVAAQPQLPLLHIALAQALLAADQKDKAIATFENALMLSPRNVPISVRYAEALVKVGSAKKAHALLLDLFNNVPPTPEQIRLIALVANAAGDTAEAYYYMGELNIANGDLMLATTQLDLALAVPGINEVQRKRFAARRDEIRDFLREERGDRSSRQRPPG